MGHFAEGGRHFRQERDNVQAKGDTSGEEKGTLLGKGTLYGEGDTFAGETGTLLGKKGTPR